MGSDIVWETKKMCITPTIEHNSQVPPPLAIISPHFHHASSSNVVTSQPSILISKTNMSPSSSSDDDDDGHVYGQDDAYYPPAADIVSESSEASTSFSLHRTPAAAVKLVPSFVGFPSVGGRHNVVLWDHIHYSKPDSQLSEVEMMKEKFAKLLLGEDMSGGGKGVCSALAISNAITNLAASVFGELWRLEPMPVQKKKMWCREMEWLLSVNDSIVDLVPSIQHFPGGGTFEVMATRPRSDLYVNLPALKKLDTMLLNMLDGFKETEFWYVDRETEKMASTCSSGRSSARQEEKWWLPCPKIPPNGLSDECRKTLQQCRDCTHQILKAAMAINSSVVDEMEVPSAYLESLPKNGRDCLGEIIYRYITADEFSTECVLDCLDLSSEHLILEVANRIEAAVHVWTMKDQKRLANYSRSRRSSWSGKVKGLVTDNDKNHVLADRAETLLRSLKIRFSGLPQTVLDMTKIQFNKDVGQAILESYSRVMESLAFNIMARIDDLLFVDDAVKQSASESKSIFCKSGFDGLPIQKRMSPSPFSIIHSPYGSPFGTPCFSLTPTSMSPGRSFSALSKLDLKSPDDLFTESTLSTEYARMWSCPGNLSERITSGDAPERD